MFNTIKSKILAITTGLLFILLFVFAVFTYLYYRDTKSLMIDFAAKDAALYAQNINKAVIKIEKNAKDLALLGELYYKFDRNKVIAEKTVQDTFENYPESLGGGIWFKAYLVDPAKRLNCVYAFRNKQNKIVIDHSFESDEYDYLNQNWYKEIMPDVYEKGKIGWSLPYFEKQGSDSPMITAGAGIFDDNGNLIGLSTVDWEMRSVIDTVASIRPTKNSFALFANPVDDYIIASTDKYLDNKELIGTSLKNIPWYNEDLVKITYFTYHNKKFIPYVKELDNGMVLILCIPKWELFANIFKSVSIMCLLLTLISLFVTYLLYAGLRKNVLRPISSLIKIANKISDGVTDIEIKVENPEEFTKLASAYDKMIKDIQVITKEKVRINSELSIAKSIQMSSLPDRFPPFPERKEFDIYASMVPAKEVGGDFYDFYFIDDNRFMFLIADVSGKGVPAALFMMTAKTLINNISQTVKNPEELITQINKKLCSNNKNGFFITFFGAIIDVATGKTYCINCGHNPPLIKQSDNTFRYLELNANIVLGVESGARFEIYETDLNKGDVMFLYTDGVTEATNDREEMFGEDRLLNCINTENKDDIKSMMEDVRKNVDEFTNSVEQSDDLTMLIFKYNGACISETESFKNVANQENYKAFYTWLHDVCTKWSLDEELVNKLDMCAEEIYANIEFYAYEGKTGDIETELSKTGAEVIMTFKDSGMQYDPLERPDPDITLAPDDRPIGGLGIFMVKQMSDDISYRYENGKNILTMIFKV